MKFLVFAPEQHAPYIEGIQKTAALTVSALRDAGHDCDVISQRSFGEAPGTAYAFELSSSPSKLRKYASWLRTAAAIARSERRDPHDKILLFSIDWSFIPAAFMLSVFAPKSSFEILAFSARDCKGLPRLLLKKIARQSNAWCASPRIADLLMECGVPKANIFLQPIFFTRETKNNSNGNDHVRESGSIGYFSASDTSAGIDTVIALAERQPAKKVHLAIRKFADSKEAAVMKKLEEIASRKLTNVEVLRNIPDMPGFLARMETVILPPHDEDSTMAVPLVALEAAQAGCRVLMTPLPVFDGLFASGIAFPFSSEDELGKILSAAPALPSQEQLEKYASGIGALVAHVTR